ncbi:hypothetical protein GCM10017774_20230 [Lentzea cavernae]|uniref:Uncharacterized protein n=1 Tax=Lentzea cavernae TaxID=2020703 RepID=A0ABQ3MA82_9PSEU|nr:hypothetical protein GCM10017774_20230 [Lentzea cavernae]
MFWVCPAAPTRPNRTVTAAPLRVISQNFAELPETSSHLPATKPPESDLELMSTDGTQGVRQF